MTVFAKIEAMKPSRRITQSMNPKAFHRKVGVLLFGTLLGLLASTASLAQHGHGVLTPGVTFPPDDSVLTESPQMITMSFRVDVRLLKLALYTADGKWISINFEYDPSRMSHSFVLPIPGELPESEYYTARWSVTDDRRGLVNGQFSFAFGSGAIPPSETIDAMVSDKVESLPSTGNYRYQRPD